MSTSPTTTRGQSFESLAGLWKLLCALAVLVGHNLVTMTSMAPDSKLLAFGFNSLQIFSPFHFFFFSGYLAATGLGDLSRSMTTTVVSRAIRIYVLVVSALALGVLARVAFSFVTEVPSPDAVWPLSVWAGRIEIGQILLHLSPLGLVDTTQFNYATWYIYHELRLVVLFPLFGWVLSRKATSTRWALSFGILLLAAALENRLWSHFPSFRSSPFQTLAFGVFFLGGALIHQAVQTEGWFRRFDRKTLIAILVAGIGFTILEPLGIRPPLKNPPILTLQTLIGQIMVFASLRVLLGNFTLHPGLRKACDWSVGIYIVHPPIHVFCAWLAVQHRSIAPLIMGMVVSILGGVVFHLYIEKPSLGLTKWLKTRSPAR